MEIKLEFDFDDSLTVIEQHIPSQRYPQCGEQRDEDEYYFIKPLEREGDVRCDICGEEFNISVNGSHDIHSHVASKRHKGCVAARDADVGTESVAGVRNETISNAKIRQRIGSESLSESFDLIDCKMEVMEPESKLKNVNGSTRDNNNQTNSNDSLDSLTSDTDFVESAVENCLRMYPFIKRISKTHAKCRQCRGEFRITATHHIKQHIYSKLHISFSPEIIELVEKRVSKLMRPIEKAYPFMKAINKHGDLKCGICGIKLNIARRGISVAERHVRSKKHKHRESVEKAYPFLKNYPFITNTLSDDVVRCKWCNTNLNIARNGDWMIKRHSRSKKHEIFAEQYNPRTGNSGLDTENSDAIHLNVSDCIEWVGDDNDDKGGSELFDSTNCDMGELIAVQSEVHRFNETRGESASNSTPTLNATSIRSKPGQLMIYEEQERCEVRKSDSNAANLGQDASYSINLDEIEGGWDDGNESGLESRDATDCNIGGLVTPANLIDINLTDASNMTAIDRKILGIHTTINEWLEIYPFIKRINDDDKANCELCGGAVNIGKRSTDIFRQHILSKRHRPFAMDIYESYQKRRTELLEKRYPFIKAVNNRKGDVRCDVCGSQFNIGTGVLTVSVTKHIASKKHEHCRAVIQKYPFVKNYPFVENAASIDVVRCKWCRTDLNIALNGDSVIEQHSRTEKHTVFAKQYTPSAGNSGLDTGNADAINLNVSNCIEWVGDDDDMGELESIDSINCDIGRVDRTTIGNTQIQFNQW